MYDVTALGELLIDFTPSGISQSGMKIFEQNPGGAPANVLAALTKLGLQTAFIGKVGYDLHGEFLKKTLEYHKIDIKGLISDKEVFTTLAFVDLNPAGERSFSFARKPGADMCLTKEEVDTTILKQTKIFHTGSLSLTDEPSRSATIFALETAKKAGAIISYDPNYRSLLWNCEEEAMERMRSVLSYVDLLKISDEETRLLTGVDNPLEASDILVQAGIPVVIVTLGKEGALIRIKDDVIIVPGYKSNVVDTTGAGDSFLGWILVSSDKSGKRPQEITIEEARSFVNFANAIASVCVEKRGAIPAMPSLDEVLERMKQQEQV